MRFFNLDALKESFITEKFTEKKIESLLGHIGQWLTRVGDKISKRKT